MYYVWAALLVFTCLGGWVLTVLGFPGNWLMVIATAIFAYFFPGVEAQGISYTMVAVITMFAVGGELLEAGAGAVAVSKGGSKKGALVGVLGSFLGSILGAVVGLPIPLVGSVLGVMIFASLGAMLGTIVGEMWAGRSAPESIVIGRVAFWGRIFGTMGKIIVSSIMVSIIIISALFA